MIAAVEDTSILDQQVVGGTTATDTVWGSFTWGAAPWGAAGSPFRQVNIPWSQPLVFKQMTLRTTTMSTGAYVLGNHYLRYQELGYNLPYAV